MIHGVFVTYNPDVDLLSKAIESIRRQVDHLFLIDNSPGSSKIDCFAAEDITVVILGANLGIAAAQNVGIQRAIACGAEYLLLSDQDTVYPEHYVSSMLAVFDEFPLAAVVVPRFIDSNKTSSDGFISISKFFFRQFFPVSGRHKIFQAIASGKIIRVSTLPIIGLMDETLFIDWVDLEWCWRARARGYEVIGNADVSILHQLGDLSKNLGFREVNLRSPMRHYYITRNSFFLSLYSKDLDSLHRINLFFRSFRYLVGFPILSKPRLENLKAVLSGAYHGVTKKLGKFELK